MTANRLRNLIAVLCGSLYGPVALAHPGHEHKRGMLESLLHAAETDWLTAVVLLVSLGLTGYFCLRKAGKR